jgi:cell division transport system permease protein
MALRVDYVTRETLTNLRRNISLTTSSMLTVGVSLLMVAFAFFIGTGVDNATERWKNGVEFEIFLNVDATPAQKTLIEGQLAESPDIDTARFVTREEQYTLFRRYFVDNPEYLENVKQEDLPESYRVRPSVEDADLIDQLGARFEQDPGVKEVVFAKDQVELAYRTSRAMSLASVVLAGLLFLTSALLIFNTTRMAIFARRREIEVMKLVGATNWFIRVPFMAEGLIQGLVGAIAAFVAIWGLRAPMSRWIVNNFEQFVGFYVPPHDVLVSGILVLVAGAVVGAASAGVAVTRFLDV